MLTSFLRSLAEPRAALLPAMGGAATPSLRSVWPSIERVRRCTLITRTAYGERHPRVISLQNRALGQGSATFWFVVQVHDDLTIDVTHEPRVELLFADESRKRSLRFEGEARLVGERPSPVYLHPSVPRGGLRVRAAPLPITLLRIVSDRVSVEPLQQD